MKRSAEVLYQAAYRTGFTPWDTGRPPDELVTLTEGHRALPPGRALDLGCGTGTNTIYLSRCGWQTTGVDLAASAITKARRRAAAAGVEPALVQGDATRLVELGLGDGFELILDLGCYHSLYPETLRENYAHSVTAVAAPGATLLLFGFLPGRLSAHRITATELQARFPDWELLDQSRGKNWLPTEAFRLRRRSLNQETCVDRIS
ncbi:class I SAM-dependent methyltransferase [Nocardia sp. CS682]|uniref:class I SAM-dependent methyltransferase n=1 Tax=Nocardia sp. CS682 TaxID=1047172 RepID=UPI0019819402|nr:class I SAM-dependent methyltransferase [Nocardia sp. CS682]